MGPNWRSHTLTGPQALSLAEVATLRQRLGRRASYDVPRLTGHPATSLAQLLTR